MTEPRTPYQPHPAVTEADRLAVLAQRLREAVASDIRPRPDLRDEIYQVAKVICGWADGLMFLGPDPASDGHALRAANALDEAALALKRLAAEAGR